MQKGKEREREIRVLRENEEQMRRKEKSTIPTWVIKIDWGVSQEVNVEPKRKGSGVGLIISVKNGEKKTEGRFSEFLDSVFFPRVCVRNEHQFLFPEGRFGFFPTSVEERNEPFSL